MNTYTPVGLMAIHDDNLGDYVAKIDYETLQAELNDLRKDKELLDALLTPAWHPVPKGWPYPDTRGRYDPPYIVQYKASLEDGTPICITDTEPINTREKLRQAINRSAHDALKGGAK